MGDLNGDDVGLPEYDVLAIGTCQRIGVDALQLAARVALPGFDLNGGADGQRLDALPVGAGGGRTRGRLLGGSGKRQECCHREKESVHDGFPASIWTWISIARPCATVERAKSVK